MQSDMTPDGLDFIKFRQSILGFFDSRQAGDIYKYYYSSVSNHPTLYASVYACLTYSLLGKLQELSNESRCEWLEYFDSFQNGNDGLFYDPVVANDLLYDNSDWWGARHLALHMITAYTDLGSKPKYPFYFLTKYLDIYDWLNGCDWSSAIGMTSDIDNKIMNIGCLLQYQRDTWEDEKARQSILDLQQYLLEKINPQRGCGDVMTFPIWNNGQEWYSLLIIYFLCFFTIKFQFNIQIK
ncbi:MAG: hypothetical protein VKL60_00950 [Sphaerospermopsis sp.]|nr:hypothetical protein [Sphaerospermopsis sp.]